MKLIKIFILLTVITTLCILIGCGQRITGTYVSEDDPNAYFELRPDGTWYAYKEIYHPYSGREVIEKEGRWLLEKDQLLIYEHGTLQYALQVKRGKLFDPFSGKFWIKKSKKSLRKTSQEKPTERSSPESRSAFGPCHGTREISDWQNDYQNMLEEIEKFKRRYEKTKAKIINPTAEESKIMSQIDAKIQEWERETKKFNKLQTEEERKAWLIKVKDSKKEATKLLRTIRKGGEE